jgi:hypothetical protein
MPLQVPDDDDDDDVYLYKYEGVKEFMPYVFI